MSLSRIAKAPATASPSANGDSRPPFLLELASIATGGAIGASLRHALGLAITSAGLHGAFGTALANVIGSFLLGLAVGWLESRGSHSLIRPFLTIGVFGSLTTLSALAFDNRLLAATAGEGLAAAQLVGMILSSLGAFLFGDFLSTRPSATSRRNADA